MVTMERVLVNVVDITHGNSNAYTLDRTFMNVFLWKQKKEMVFSYIVAHYSTFCFTHLCLEF